MLPIITVGLTPAARAVMERIPGDRGQAHYDTAEAALWDFGSVSNPVVAQVSLDAKGRLWSCHVFYGDNALGPLLTATKESTVPTRVPCQGLQAVITDTMGSDPREPVRVVEGQPEHRTPPVLASVEAVQVLQAGVHLIVDQLPNTPNWQNAVAAMLDRAEPADTGELGFVPGEEARAELARLEELRKRGQSRPGHFEAQDRGLRAGGLLP